MVNKYDYTTSPKLTPKNLLHTVPEITITVQIWVGRWVRFTYVAPQTASALCITDTAVVQLRPQFKPALTNFGLQPHSCTYP